MGISTDSSPTQSLSPILPLSSLWLGWRNVHLVLKVIGTPKVVVRAIENLFSPMRLFLDKFRFIGIARIFIKRVIIPNDFRGLQKGLDNSLSTWDYEANSTRDRAERNGSLTNLINRR